MDKGLFRNFVFNMIKTFFSIIYPLITVPYISRILTVKDIGIVNFALSYVDILLIFATLGIPTYVLREGAKLRDDKKKLSDFLSAMFELVFVSSLIIYLVYCISIFVCDTFKSDKLIYLVLGFIIVINIFDVSYVFNIFEDFSFITKRTIFFQILSLAVLILTVKDETDIYWYVVTLLISKCGNSIISFKYSKKYIDWHITVVQPYKNYINSILIFFIISVASNIYLSADKVMLGFICSKEEVGLYTAATKLIQIFRNVVSTISAVCLPRAIYYYRKETIDEYRKLIVNIISIILMCTIPFGIGVCCVGDRIIQLIFGKAYMEAVYAFKILALNCSIALINGVLAYQILSPKKKEKVIFIATFVGCVFNIVLNYFLLPIYGINGAAMTTFISEIITFLIMIPFCKVGIPLKKIVGLLGKYSLGCVPFILVYELCKERLEMSYFYLVLYIMFSALSYFIILVIQKNELIIFLRKIKRGKNNGNR